MNINYIPPLWVQPRDADARPMIEMLVITSSGPKPVIPAVLTMMMLSVILEALLRQLKAVDEPALPANISPLKFQYMWNMIYVGRARIARLR